MSNTNEEFQEAFEAARDRLERNRMEFKITVEMLQAADLFRSSELGDHLFVCKGPHPFYRGLIAVVWCSPRGELLIDALSPNQVIPVPVVNRHESTEERAQRFREWYIERKPE